jgi:hypothetical protein
VSKYFLKFNFDFLMKLWEIISNSKFKNKHVLQKIIMHLLGLEDKSQIVSLYDVDLSKLKDKN